MRHILSAVPALLLPIMLPLTPASATSIAQAPPHDPVKACAAIKGLIANLNAGRVKDAEDLLGPTFYSDLHGEVADDEEAAFIQSMQTSEGKPDKAPISLYHAYTLLKERDRAIYLVVLERVRWRETRLGEDAMMDVQRIRDPRYTMETSYWLASFWSNEIHDFREAGELYPLMGDKTELKNCWD